MLRANLRWWLMACMAAGGCGGSEPAQRPGPPAPATAETAQLPRLADPIPLLDEERIEIAPPQGWHVPARSSKFIARFQQRADSLYPTIILTADDYDFPDVAADNVNELASRIAAEESLAAIKPFQVGRFLGVTYRKRGIERESINKVLERLFLATVVAGRRYTLELRTREGSLAEAQPHLIAVAEGMRFPKAEAAPPASEEAAPAADAPADGEAGPASGKTEAKPSEEPKTDGVDLGGVDLDELLKQ